MKMFAALVTISGVLMLGGLPAEAQVTPAPALDAPTPPLAGPPLNQPPRQGPPSIDARSDPSFSNAEHPQAPLTMSRQEQRCLLRHPGYNVATHSYTGPHGRFHSCG